MQQPDHDARQLVATAVALFALLALLALLATTTGCANAAGGGGGLPSAQADTPCYIAEGAEQCGYATGLIARLVCKGGSYEKLATCAANEYCATPAPATTACKALPTTDAGSAIDSGSANDGSAASDAGATTGDTGDDTGGGTAGDTGGAGATDTHVAVDSGGPVDAGSGVKQLAKLPVIKLKDVNPGSPFAGQTFGLEKFQGKYIAVLMGAGWCASCNAQADYMEAMRRDLEAQGRTDFVMIVVNDKSAGSASYQKTMATCSTKSKCKPVGSMLGYPVLQGTSTYGWKTFTDPKTGQAGKKNDCFIYAPDGRFIFKHIGKGIVNLTQFDKEVRKALNTKL